MKDIITYKIGVRAIGGMTQLPDSQKIFGALMGMYAQYTSPEETTQLVQGVMAGDCYVAISNLLPKDYLPVPQDYLLEMVADDKNGVQLGGKAVYQAIKKRSYTGSHQLKQLCENPAQAANIYPYISVEASQQIHAAIESLRYDLPGLDPNLYSVPEITVVERSKEMGQGTIVREFTFYLSIDKGETQFPTLLKKAKDEERLFFMGPRVSQGLNMYTIQKIEPTDISLNNNSQEFLNLGMLLPNEIDYEKSTLKLFTSERRPYESWEGWDKNSKKKCISFIEAGSIIHLNNGCKKAGKSIKSPYEGRGKEIIFGNAFLYPMVCLLGGGKND